MTARPVVPQCATLCVMRRVGVRELRQNLSVHLRAIQATGEAIEVTDRGRAVAVLAPLPVDDEYEAMIAAGTLRPAGASWDTLPAPIGAVSTAGTDALDELRDERL